MLPLSYEYIASQLPKVAPDIARGRVVVAHRERRFNVRTVHQNEHREYDGVHRARRASSRSGTRPGQLDAGVVLYLITEKGMSAEGDRRACSIRTMRTERPFRHQQRRARTARQLRPAPTCDRPLSSTAFGLFTGMLAAAIGGHRRLVFTAGVGERRHHPRRDGKAGSPGSAQSSTRTANARSRQDLHLEGRQPRRNLRHSDRRRAMIARHTLGCPSAAEARPIPRTRRTACNDPRFQARRSSRARTVLVAGIANDQSIAWGCAKAFCAFGAELAMTYLNDKAKKFVEPLARELKAESSCPSTSTERPDGGRSSSASKRTGAAWTSCALDPFSRPRRHSGTVTWIACHATASSRHGRVLLVASSGWLSSPNH